MEQTKYPLWKNRNELKRPSLPVAVLMVIAAVALSAITAAGFGGMFCTGLAGCAFALLLVSVRGFIPWITIPLSFGCAFLLTGDIILSLCVLLYVPVGIILAYCAFTERNLSVTVAALTVAILISMGAIFTVSVTELYGQSVAESYRSFWAEMKKSLFEMFSQMKYPSADGEAYAIPEEIISALIETAVMILPAVVVVTCEALAYITARIFRSILFAFGPGTAFAQKDYGITISVPCAVIYLASVAVSFFATEASVIAYSAINLAYILMPACAVAGFKLLFRRDGIIRRKREGRRNGIWIGIMIFLAVMSPIAFVQMLSSFACIFTVARAIIALKSRSDED